MNQFSAPEPAHSLAGADDSLQRLWTPHRMAYIDSYNHPDTPACPFCVAPQKSDEDGLIVGRGQHCFVVLNLYPYNPGHVLICPYRHVADYTDLSDEEAHEVADLTRQSMRVIRQVSGPAGFNIGLNQGRVAGTGVADHFHTHVVPRWSGDANFFPIIAQTKAIPQLLAETRQMLSEAWDRL